MNSILRCWRILVFQNTTNVFARRTIYSIHKILDYSKFNSDYRKVSISKSCISLRSLAKGIGGKKPKSAKSKVHLSDEEMMEVINVEFYRNDLQELVDKMKKDFVEHLMIRSAAGGLENLLVTIDNEEFPLNELAQISRKNPNLIAINMSGFPEGLKPAIKSITESGLGLNPQQEGTMIYLSIPKITREFREKLAKNAKTLFGKTKDDIRQVQNSFVKEARQKTSLSEDLVFNTQQQIGKIAEDYAAEAEKMYKAKTKELLGDS